MATSTLERSCAADLLMQSPQPLLRRLHVEERDDEVVLAGRVPTFFLKQLAQETIRPFLGSRRLLNRIVVD